MKGQNCIIKTQNFEKSIEVFFSEKIKAFYLVNTKHKPNTSFKHLITCKELLFNDFLNYLEKFIAPGSNNYNYDFIKNKLNSFLIKRANNCKVKGNYEVGVAS